jgi:hypothetical protein
LPFFAEAETQCPSCRGQQTHEGRIGIVACLLCSYQQGGSLSGFLSTFFLFPALKRRRELDLVPCQCLEWGNSHPVSHYFTSQQLKKHWGCCCSNKRCRSI